MLRVSTIVEPPFLDIVDISVDGNGQFSGFLKDLLTKMTKDPIIDADFYLLPVVDGQYGRRLRRGVWDGMIGELYRREVDIAAAALVPLDDRRQAVSFSRPYMQGGITMVVYRDPNEKSANNTPAILSPRDLLNRTDIVPGFVQFTSVQTFFEKTKDPVLQQIYQRMQETKLKPNPFAYTVEEGIRNLRDYKDKYVLFVDSNFAEYYAARWPCDLVLVGELTRQSFALAFPKKSPWRPKFNRVLEKMTDNGELWKLVREWWNGSCSRKVGVYKYESPKQTVGVAIEAKAGQAQATGYRLKQNLAFLLCILTVTLIL